jgi:RNA polymerase sigma-70 factor (ECF subfamily)
LATRPTSDPADAHLVGRARAGSQAAYRELVRRYQGPVLNLVARIALGRAEAEDLTQEIFVKAFAALDRYDPTRRFSSWLFKIAHNHTLDRLRQSRPPTVSMDTGTDPVEPRATNASPSALVEQARLAAALESALDGLRVEYREAIVLRYQAELSLEEIGDIMAIPEGTVKTYLHRGRKALAAEMAARGWGPASRSPETRDARGS